MFKIKNFKVEFKHLLTVASALGMVAGFIVSLCSRKKALSATLFFTSLAGFVTGMGMEAGVVPTPAVCKKLEIEIEPEEDAEEGSEEAVDVETEDTENAEDAQSECADEDAE